MSLKKEIQKHITESKGFKNATIISTKWFYSGRLNVKDNSIVYSREQFKPGKIYVFRYNNPLNKSRMWDMNPIVLSLGRIDGLDVGINLNFLTYNEKLKLLTDINSKFKNVIGSIVERKGSSVELQTPLNQIQYEKIKHYLEKNNFTRALRRYRTGARTHVTVIGYTNWKHVPFIDLADIALGDINEAINRNRK